MAFSPPSSQNSTSPPIGGLAMPQVNSGRRLFRLLLIWGFISLVCGFLDWRAVQGVGFSTFDSYFYEMKVKLSAHRNADLGKAAQQQIVIVPITDDSFNPENPDCLQDGPPTSRADYAKVLRSLKASGAKAVVFDVVFKIPHHDSVDKELIDAATAPGAPTVWACLVEDEDKKGVTPQIMRPFEELRKASPHEGHILSPQESGDGGVRSIETIHETADHRFRFPALSVAAVMASEKQSAPFQDTATGWRSGSLALPDVFNIQFLSDTNEENTNSFPTVPFELVAKGVAQNDPFYSEFFKDRIVIIGDETKLSNDFRNTPVGVLPGVEIQANAIASVLMAQSGAHPLAWEVPDWVAFGVLALLCGLTVFIAARFAPMRGALSIAGLAVAYFVFEAVAFVDHGVILHTVGPTVAITLGAMLVFLERGVWEEREKMYVRGLLGRYVSPSVAEYILRHPERCSLGGEEVNATVLFADIRGFTALTERFPPRVTLQLLNDYFQAMSDVVFAHDGMVDKFMGDAIMAIFGAPVETTDHPVRALSAAIQMLERIDELQVRWKEQGLPTIRVGIGVGTGTMIVGNMGSEMRADFSVVGDAVNLAARLQDLNKELGTIILISSATREACEQMDLPEWVTFEEGRHVQVRGHANEDEVFPVRVEPIRVVSEATHKPDLETLSSL